MKIFTGQSIRISFDIGISTALVTSAVLKYKDPNGLAGEFTEIGVLDDEYLYYDSVGDFDIAGDWILWGSITTSSGVFPSAPFIVEVVAEGGFLITTLSKVKRYLGISDTSKDDLINDLIPLCQEDYLTIRNVPFDETFPKGSDVTIAEMIGYKLSVRETGGKEVSSESIDSYSVSFNSGSIGGYPKSITSSIKRYIRGD